MPFIPNPYLMTLSSHLNNYHKEINKKNYEEKEEKETKITMPKKCLNCAYCICKYCSINKNQNIINLDSSIIDNCNEMKRLIGRREQLRRSTWKPINKLLLKAILSDYEPDSNIELIYNNFELTISKFTIWEIIAVLSWSEGNILKVGKLIPFREYNNIFKYYLEYIDDLYYGKIEEFCEVSNQDDSSCDYATLILLKNFLSRFRDNENAICIQEMLTKDSSLEDVLSAITLLYEVGLLTSDSKEYQRKLTI